MNSKKYAKSFQKFPEFMELHESLEIEKHTNKRHRCIRRHMTMRMKNGAVIQEDS